MMSHITSPRPRRTLVKAGKKGFKIWSDRVGSEGLKDRSLLMLHTRHHVNKNRYQPKCRFCLRKRR